ncbi:3-[(3aS,4S,7aS)-7a-methyl-1,5-dioxo-octahydro-1H-inden-4-yl]propanoyl:CoA ligase [Williamsia phyllosphaerae]|uniref:3-[(3aS,4S,7aS)-7a-methyl-1, 5-dioxo-octahydro-1H-inden-4-yl]propanoyl:CoA ligase n=1 Tax=Williamsia phyllosphaerae TaxID=885042 RepID=A0ABQ1ULU3_9NOCA|nr:3-[(3aS,4S,7aS)-7a-methyl-1,5-dioxo-octahydro-1H-inden-4-yl]propanoyl:CoA ligase [Williamsia phyllosphaerae]
MTDVDLVQTTPQALRRAALMWPDQIAVVDSQWGEDIELTWSELLGAVRTFAGALIRQGIGAGDRVAIWAPNSVHWPIAALGAHFVGATLVPVNTRYTATEVLDVLVRTHSRALVVPGVFLGVDRLAELAALADLPADTDLIASIRIRLDADDCTRADHGIDWNDFLSSATDSDRAEADTRADAVRPDDVSDILFTSGTTGRSKGVVAEHRQSAAGARAWGANGALSTDDRYLMVNPYFHTFGYKAGILACTLFGVTMLPLAVYSAEAAMTLVASQRATVFPGAPTIFQTILDADSRVDHDLSSLRLVVTGAAIVPVVLVERIQRDLGVATVITAYGLSETSGFVSTCTPDDDDETVANTCGRAFAGMEIALSDAGEVLARGDMVMRGYLDDETATAETIDADGWLHTGDIGTIDERGNLRITDRLKDMYICGGFNVYPAEVEQTLVRFDAVTEAAVIGVPDERLGEVGRAYLTVRSGAHISEDEVIAHCRSTLANFKVPRSVVVIDEFPRNAAGKILKRELSSLT